MEEGSEPSWEGGPQLPEIVSTDFPEAREWKQFHSNWARFVPADYFPPLPEFISRIVLGVSSSVGAAIAAVLESLGRSLFQAATQFIAERVEAVFQLQATGAISAGLQILGLALGAGLGAFLKDFVTRQLSSPWLLQIRVGLATDREGVRQVWLGGGQVQFGCGPKGISVEHHGGYTYFLRWSKVLLIYDRYSPTDLPVLTDPEGFDISSEEWLPEDARRQLNDLGAAKVARDSIRIRLKHEGRDGLWDELILPKSFFNEGLGSCTWREFLVACWRFKYFLQDGAAGQSVGSVHLPEPRPRVVMVGRNRRRRVGYAVRAGV